MKVVTWNVNRAGVQRKGLWDLVEREDADIVLLQEVPVVPPRILNAYQCYWVTPRYFDGHNAPFSSAILAKGLIDATPHLASEMEWINRIHAECYGWIQECAVTMRTGERYRVVSVHSPAFPIPQTQWRNADASGIKLKNNPDLWFTEILWALLRATDVTDDTNWIVGGDFNNSVLFDEPRDRGNREIGERLNTLGLTDCLGHSHDGPIPTFRSTRRSVKHQLDYCYVNAPMLERLTRAQVPDHMDVFCQKPRLSDHLPIVCEFD